MYYYIIYICVQYSFRQDLSDNVIDKRVILLYNTTTNGAVKVSTGVLKPAKHVEFA